MVDLHSHLIWGIDDGSKSKEMTINMLRQAVEGGTKKLVLTPHYLPGHYEVPLNEVKEKREEVSLLTREQGLDIEIYCGQEVYFNEKIIFEVISHRYTSRAKNRILEIFPETTLPMNDEDRKFKYGQFGYGKYLYNKEDLTDMKEFFMENLKSIFPNSIVKYII